MELLDLVEAEWPSTKAEEFLKAVRDRSQEAAEAMAKAIPAAGGGAFQSIGLSKDDQADAFSEVQKGYEAETVLLVQKLTDEQELRAADLEKQSEALQARLDQVALFIASERDLEVARHEEKVETLAEALEQELITAEEHDIALQEIEERHMQAMADIRSKGMTALEWLMQMSFANQAKTVLGGLADMTAGLSRSSKTMFEVNKVAGIANATIAMFQGIAESLKLGWPMAIPAVPLPPPRAPLRSPVSSPRSSVVAPRRP